MCRPPSATRHRDGGRRPAPPRPWRMAREPATGHPPAMPDRRHRDTRRRTHPNRHRGSGPPPRNPRAEPGPTPGRRARDRRHRSTATPTRHPFYRAGPGGNRHALPTTAVPQIPHATPRPVERPPHGAPWRRDDPVIHPSRGATAAANRAAGSAPPAPHGAGGPAAHPPRPTAEIQVAAQRFPHTATRCATGHRRLRVPPATVTAGPPTPRRPATAWSTDAGRFPAGAACRPRHHRRGSLHRTGSAPLDRITAWAAERGRRR